MVKSPEAPTNPPGLHLQERKQALEEFLFGLGKHGVGHRLYQCHKLRKGFHNDWQLVIFMVNNEQEPKSINNSESIDIGLIH